MINKIENEKLLSDLMNLFDHLKVEDSPNQPIANAIGILNEPLIRQITDGIYQETAELKGFCYAHHRFAMLSTTVILV